MAGTADPRREPELRTLVRAAAARCDGSPFFAVGEEAVTAAEFGGRVEAAAAGLRAAGLAPGGRVAVLLERSVDEAVALLAAAVAGGIAVPINGKLKDAQIAHVLLDAEPFAVVTSSLRLLALRDPAAVLGAQRLFTCGSADLPAPLVAAPLAVGAAPAAGDGPPLAPDDPAVILYTSGSTGLSKGVVQTHGNLVRGAAVVGDFLGLTAADHVLALLPSSFDYGLNQLLSALLVGCRITGADHLGVGELADLLARVQPTGLAGVPWLWHEVARALTDGTLSREHGAALRYVTNSGGILRAGDSAALREHWPGVSVFAMYGLTEAFRSAFLPPDEIEEHPESFGFAIPGVELLVVDPATDEVLEGPATGELVHAGDLIAMGYWRNRAATAHRFRPDPRGLCGPDGKPSTVVYSGDLVRRDAAGRHWFVARRDRLLKVQGHRISPDEVAAVFAAVPDVAMPTVVGIDGGAAGHELVLIVVGDAENGALERDLRRIARGRLPSYMQPARYLVVDEMPRNPHGKVDEGALRQMIAAWTGSH
ncbi:MAG: AMP-binding protein [bacterium]|nr:AMP-binding protein [bacterium]